MIEKDKRTNIKFSIIVPVYNVEKYLAECLDSILHQTYSNYEIICINDASTDSSYEILLDYANRYEQITIINNERNRGLSYNRNIGMKIANGEFIWFIDSDDYIKKSSLEILASYIEGKQVDVINFRHEQISESEYYIENAQVELKLYKKDLQRQTGQQWLVAAMKEKLFSITGCTKIYCKKFLYEHSIDFYEDILYEDMLFVVKVCLYAQNVYNIDDVLYTYRRREGAITSTKTTKHLDSCIVVANELLTLWKTTNLEPMTDYALEECINYLLLNAQKFTKYFPEHQKLYVGKPEDQFFFNWIIGSSTNRMHKYVQLNSLELEQIKNNSKRIIFGAGTVATELIQELESNNIEIDAVAVTNKEINATKFGKYKVFQIDELEDEKKDALVIVAVVNRKQGEIEENLKTLGYTNIMLLDTERKNNSLK